MKAPEPASAFAGEVPERIATDGSTTSPQGRGLAGRACSDLFISEQGIERESSFFQDSSENYLLIPWLNLLWLSPELARSRDQLRWVARPVVPRDMYDNPLVFDLLQKLKAKLREIYPDSFLLRLYPEQIEYREAYPLPVTLEHLISLIQQILSFDSLDLIGGEMNLAVLVHTASQQVQKPILNKTSLLAENDYEARRLSEGETWLWDINFPNVPDEESPLASGMAPARVADPAGDMPEVPKGRGFAPSVCWASFLGFQEGS